MTIRKLKKNKITIIDNKCWRWLEENGPEKNVNDEIILQNGEDSGNSDLNIWRWSWLGNMINMVVELNVNTHLGKMMNMLVNRNSNKN